MLTLLLGMVAHHGATGVMGVMGVTGATGGNVG